MRRLADLPLLVKMGFAPFVALLALAIVTAGAYVAQKQQSAALQQVVQQDMTVSLRFAALERKIAAAHGEMYVLIARQAGGVQANQVQARSKDLLASVDDMQRELQDLKASAPPDQQGELQTLTKDLKDFRGAVEVVGSMIGVDAQTATAFALPFETQYLRMMDTLHATAQAVQARAQNAAARSITSAQVSVMMGAAYSILALLIVGVTGWFAVTGVQGAIRRIADATQTLAKGDTGLDLDKLARADELGAIVDSLRVFKDHQLHLDKMRLEQDALHAGQQAVVTGLAEGLDRLAGGDLTFRLNAPFAEEYEKLRADFNAAMNRLQDTVKVIARNTQSMRSGAGEISQAADDLSRRTEQQAASLEQTATALDQITATVRRTADGANQAQATVAAAKGDAERSGQVVRDAVAAMGQIEKSAREIAQIIGVIDEIAFQTNLLALNAGVEAARAGDAGRGFAVVATEVRALAQRSAEAAKEIKALISASSHQVGSGVDLVGQTGKALQRIVEQVTEINGVVAEISASAQEQSTGLHQVNSAVNQMDHVTQQNAAMVEQSTAASHALAQEAEALSRLVARFNTGEDYAEAPVHAPPRYQARPPEPPARPAYAPRAYAAPAAPAYGRAATARKIEPQAEDEGWEEF